MIGFVLKKINITKSVKRGLQGCQLNKVISLKVFEISSVLLYMIALACFSLQHVLLPFQTLQPENLSWELLLSNWM